jgi:hypothetical protein
MRIVLEIPDYDGNSLDVIWEADSKYEISVQKNSVVISANKDGLISLAKQMLYMAHNDLPSGSHVHYDSFFTKGSNGCPELIVEKKED